MSDPCPHMEAILQDDQRFDRGYYQSGRERADLIFAVQMLRELVAELRADIGQRDAADDAGGAVHE